MKRLLRFFLFVDDGIDAGNGGDIDDVAHGALDVCKVNRFVQSHLNRADDLRFAHALDKLVGGVGRAQVREYQCVHSFPFRRVKGYFSSRSALFRANFTCISPSIAKSGYS